MTTQTDNRGPERFASQDTEESQGSVGKALGAALALIVLLIGVPVALWFLTGPPPIPTGLPSRSELSQPIGLDLMFTILRAVVWLAWLQFAVCTVVEMVSFVRGGGLPRAVPLSGPSQAVARALVGTLLVGVSFLASSGGATAAAEVVASTSSSPVASAEQSPGQGNADSEASEEQASHVKEAPRKLSVPGVPADMTDVIGHKVAIVLPPQGHYHDNLWDIAERHLGDGRRWKEIYELNQHRDQPDGQRLVLGRLIQPGWVLKMPNDATGVQRVTEEQQAPVKERPQQRDAPPSVDAEQSAQASGDSVAPSSSLADDLLAGGLLGGAVLGALLVERRRRGARGVGPEDAETEVALRVGADPERTARLDRALRSLSAACGEHDVPLPPVYAAEVSDQRIALRLAGQHHGAPGSWTVEDDGRVWMLDAEVALGAESEQAPYPGLVCLGRDDQGSDVLVDLESADGIVSIDGSPVIARQVVSALAVQLVTAPWADDQRVLGHDLGQALTQIGTPGIEPVANLDTAITDLSGAVVQLPAAHVLTGRAGPAAGTTPHYLAIGSLPDDAAGERLSALTHDGTRGLGILVAGRLATSRWRATVDDAGRLSLPLLDVEVDAARLGDDTAENLAALFSQARTPRAEPAEGRTTVPPTPSGAGDDSTWSSARVRVGALGPVEVRAQGQMDDARLALATEIVVFLAVQTEPVHPSVVGASVWPRGVTPDVRDATIERVRDWLGSDADGNHLLRVTEGGRLQLASDVGVDWQAFCVLARRSRDASAREEPELLRRALQLVRGPFLAETPVHRYSWIVRTGLEQGTEQIVVDVAHRLAQLCHHDPAGGAAAARAGLRLAPHSQLLWRDLLLAVNGDDDPDAAAVTVQEMTATLQSLDLHPDAETTALVEELLPGRSEETG